MFRCGVAHTADDSDVKPLQLNLTLQLSVLDAARQRALLFVAEKTAGDNSYDYRGEREKKAGHDMWAFSSALRLPNDFHL